MSVAAITNPSMGLLIDSDIHFVALAVAEDCSLNALDYTGPASATKHVFSIAQTCHDFNSPQGHSARIPDRCST
jgi:hypothetical protein